MVKTTLRCLFVVIVATTVWRDSHGISDWRGGRIGLRWNQASSRSDTLGHSSEMSYIPRLQRGCCRSPRLDNQTLQMIEDWLFFINKYLIYQCLSLFYYSPFALLDNKNCLYLIIFIINYNYNQIWKLIILFCISYYQTYKHKAILFSTK